ncbi:SsgA family sporulation/cell division regulator [Kitasatospora viridis]|nr:SsgA family sporulation/cell division regulator [Kitasatospora viridis]
MTVRLITGAAQGRELVLECRYEADDPWAVALDFGPQEGAVWTLSRELLAAGLREPAGHGDVHLEPDDRGGVLIALSGTAGVALLTAPRVRLAGFLAATEAVVPIGAESAHVDWDRCISELLST